MAIRCNIYTLYEYTVRHSRGGIKKRRYNMLYAITSINYYCLTSSGPGGT